MTTFEFATAGRIIFGAGAIAQLPSVCRDFGRHAFVVSGKSPARAAIVCDLLAPDVQTTRFVVDREPDLSIVADGVAAARDAGCDVVIGVGGGSVLDAAKAIAALVTNEGDVLDYLEVIGGGRPLRQPSLSCVAIPTTAGTGSEVTRNAVLASPAHRVKVSLRSPSMLPRVALVDPDLSAGAPLALAARAGLDALTQLIEPYLSCRANPTTDALCAQGIPLAAAALRPACLDGDPAAHASLALASLWSGLALANAGLGAVHGFAGPLGGMFGAPHGALCATLLPHVLAANLRALRTRAPESSALRRFDDVARWITSRPDATADEGVAAIRSLVHDLGVSGLAIYGVRAADIPTAVDQASQSSSMKGNPIPLTAGELAGVLSAAL